MISRYEEISNEIESLNIPFKTKALTLLTSILIALLITSGPITLIINLMIYVNLRKLLVLGLWFFFSLLIFLIYYFYLIGITQKKINKLYYIYITNTSIVSFILLIFIYILFNLGVF